MELGKPLANAKESNVTYIARFEQALHTSDGVDLRDYLPSKEHPYFAETAIELILIDMENSWSKGKQRSVPDYVDILADLVDDESFLSCVAHEEFRQRRRAGEKVRPEDFAQRYGISTDDWDKDSAPSASSNLGTAVPEIQRQWNGFDILALLGESHVSRVVLARQRSLDERLVVLKFTPARPIEPTRVAKLNHPGVIPTYSIEATSQCNVHVMPFVGRRTFADAVEERCTTTRPDPDDVYADLCFDGGIDQPLKRLKRYIDRTLWMVGRIAEALDHIHRQRVVHSNLKPSNILLNENGLPVLLDIDLDTGFGGSSETNDVLPYTSPQRLQSIYDGDDRRDPRDDIYSLGVILYQLLAGELPYPEPESEQSSLLLERIEQRQSLPPSLRKSFCGSADIASIIKKCLRPDPKHRYQSAKQLKEDIQCLFSNHFLKHAQQSATSRFQKFRQRHPRLFSYWNLVGLVVLTCGAVAAAGYYHHRRQLKHSALTKYETFRRDYQKLRPQLTAFDSQAVDFTKALDTGQEMFAKYVVDTVTWKEQAVVQDLEPAHKNSLQTDLASLSYLLATGNEWAALRSSVKSEYRLRTAQRMCAFAQFNAHTRMKSVEAVSNHVTRLLEPERAASQPDKKPSTSISGVDGHQLGIQLFVLGKVEAAAKSFESALTDRSHDPFLWFDKATAHTKLNDPEQAFECYTKCIALSPANLESLQTLAYFGRAEVALAMSRYDSAIRDIDRFIEKQPNVARAHMICGISHHEVGNQLQAIAAFDEAIKLKTPETRAYFLRSAAKLATNDTSGSKSDLQEGLGLQPEDALSFLARAEVLLEDKQTDAALLDIEHAKSLAPQNAKVRELAAATFATLGDRNDELLGELTWLIEKYPQSGKWIAKRARIYAEQGNLQDAINDAKRTYALEWDAEIAYDIASTYGFASKTSKDYAFNSLRALADAFRRDSSLAKKALEDDAFEHLRAKSPFLRLIGAAKTLQSVRPISR